MKKYGTYFFIAILMMVMVPMTVLGVTEADSPVSVQIGEIEKPNPKPEPNPKPKPPVDVYKPAPPKDGGGRLPQTGEMIQTLIFLLIGVSVILIVIGLIVMKQIFGRDFDEFEDVATL